QRGSDFNFALLAPARESRAALGIEYGSDGNPLAFAAPNHPNAQRMTRAGELLHADIFPSGFGGIADLDDLIALMQPGFRGGAIGHDVADFGRRLGWKFREPNHEQAREHGHRENDVHRGSGKHDDQALPAWLALETAGVGGVFVARLFAHHFYVTAQQHCGEAKVRLALLEAKQA